MHQPAAPVQPAQPLPAGTSHAGDPDGLLVRGLGLRQLTANIFNYTVGSGIFVLPALVVAQLGPAAPLAYLLCALVMGLVVLVFAEAGSRVTVTGGPYAYVATALGPLPGLIAGALLTLVDVAAAGAVVTVLAGSLARLLGVSGAIWQAAFVIVFVAGLALVNIRGVRWGARVIEVSTLAKLAPLLFLVAVGAFFVVPARLSWPGLPAPREVAHTSGTLIFAFAGIEAALLPSGEVRDPARTIPRAAILALSFVTLLYLAVQAVALGVLGPALAGDKVAPLANVAGAFAGRAGATLLLAGASISMFGFLTGTLLAGPRGLFALARDGFLPRAVASVHPRFHTPYVAIALYGVLALALALSGTFETLAVLSNLAALGLYFLAAIAVWVLRRRGVRGEREPFRMPGGATVPVLACAAIAWIITQTITRPELIAFAVLLGACVVVYALRRNAGAPAAVAAD